MVNLPKLITFASGIMISILPKPLPPLTIDSPKCVRFSEDGPLKLKAVCYMPRQWVEDNDVIRNDLKAMTASDAIPILDHHYLTRFIGHPNYEFLKYIKERLDSWVLMIDSYAERINKICEAHQPKMGRKSDKAHGAQFEYQHDYGARSKDFERMSQEAHEEIQVRILEATPCCPVCLETFQEPEKASDGQWKWEKLHSCRGCKMCFHIECLDKWLSTNRTCPCCRARIQNSHDDISSDELYPATTQPVNISSLAIPNIDQGKAQCSSPLKFENLSIQS
ncbi:hypothetical protein H4Q26_013151 [Puccinia striiformis f. sp. tritici PST-130]|nr:hypothetical protein H4Q26_013151 [Puccinia striiformis f. sp. tritici PST-130]